MSRRNKLLMKAVRRHEKSKRKCKSLVYIASQVQFYFRTGNGDWESFDGALKRIEYTGTTTP